MNDSTDKELDSKQGQHETFFGVGSDSFQPDEHEWYQDNLDIVIPMLFIAAGLYQFVLRKWILPVPDDVISKLEDQLPTQGLLFMPEFGLFLAIAGVVLLLLFMFI